MRARMNKIIDAATEIDLARLRRIYKSIKDGMGGVADFFEVSKPDIQDGKQGFGFKKDRAPAGEGQPQGQKPEDDKKAQTPPTQAPEPTSAAPTAGGTPPPQPGTSVSDLMRRIMVQSKESGVKLETIERWASKTYGQNLVGCSVLNLQAILMRLQQGQSFDA